jgi:predicted regulator of Ras-like GTPase activity (Roadblock/LC7/MglB family)
MTAETWAWIMSCTGAALFFAAGSLFTLRAGAMRAHAERDTHERERVELERIRLEREQLRAALAEADLAQHNLTATAKECDRLRASQASVEKTVREANARADQAWRELAAVAEQLRGSRKREASEPPSVPDAGARGDVLRTILDRETYGNGFTGAVIADELGLVVAAKGEYGDALAAYGAFLAGVGAKTRDALPLRELRQLTIQDDCDTTLTVRPIASAEDHLALVTLAAGSRERANASS